MSVPSTGTRLTGKFTSREVSPGASLKPAVPPACSCAAQQLSTPDKNCGVGWEQPGCAPVLVVGMGVWPCSYAGGCQRASNPSPCWPWSRHPWWWGRSGACREPPGLGGSGKPRCPTVPTTKDCHRLPFCPSLSGNCVLAHVLSPAGRVGACKRFALIWLNSKVG